ncbi:MAG: hypothetical protein WCY01_12695, partial [Alkalispirochaeta sp.]
MGKIGRVAGVVVLLALVVVGCPAPVSLTDDAVRNYDTEPPLKPTGGGVLLSDDYDTTPQWNWTGAGGGSGYFRVRVNGASWQEGVTSPWPNPTVDYYPGVYVFEVQERDAAGNWSEVLSVTTTIKVREPTFTAAVYGSIQNRQPNFGWAGYTPLQHGSSRRFAYKLEQKNGNGWVVVDGQSSNDTGLTTYTITSPLPDGQYRFGVAEWNDGGARSDFAYANFRVDFLYTPGIVQTSMPPFIAEGGSGSSYSVVLGSPPIAPVTITPVSSTMQVDFTPHQLTFTDLNWNTSQVITVRAIDDAVVEGQH